MATGNSVYDEIREQHRHMKDKPLKEKLLYFWEYYRVTTLVILLVLLFAGSLIYTVATRKTNALNIIFLNTYLKQDVDPAQLGRDFLSFAQIDTKKYQTSVEAGLYVDYELMDGYTVANMQKIVAMTASSSLDVLITDDTFIENNLDAGMFADLSEILPAEMLSAFSDKLLYMDAAEDDKGAYPVGIDIRDLDIFLSDRIPAYFCVVTNAPNREAAVTFLSYLTGE